MIPRLGEITDELTALARELAGGAVDGHAAAARLRALLAVLNDAAGVAEREAALFKQAANATQVDLEQKLEEISLLRIVADISGQLLSSPDPFKAILDNLLPITHADSVSIFIVNYETERLEFVSAAGAQDLARTNRPSFALGEGVAGRVAASGEAIVVPDTRAFSDFAHRADTVVHIRSLAAFPLRVGHVTIGVLNLSSAQTGLFSDETVRVLHIIASQLSNVVQSARLLAQQRAQQAQIRESERRYRELIEEVNDGFFILDAHGKTRLANQRLAQIFGRSTAEVYAAESWAPFLAPEVRDGVLAIFRKLETGRAGMEEELEFPVLLPGGAEVPVMMRCRALERDGALVWIGMVRDMRAQKELQRQLLQSEKLAAMGTLVAGTTHELNNKLAPILGYAQLLQQLDLPEDVRRRLGLIETAAAGAKSIVDALLGFSRDSEAKRECVAVSDIIDGVLALSQSALRRDNVRVVRYDEAGTPRVHVARQQLEQVVLNMVNNAMHAMEPGPHKLLEVWTGREGDRVVIGIRDTGTGIAPDHLTRIFDPFFTTKGVNEGTGLGLSLSYGIVRSHGGEITVDSAVGRGTTFRILLPAAADAGPPDAVPAPAARVAAGWEGTPRVLVVDDEGMVRDLLCDILGDFCAVELAPHGRAALELLRAQPADAREFGLLIVDLRMPEMDGMSLYRALEREFPQCAGRIVFMTGDTYDPDTQRFLDECKRPYITKPFDLTSAVQTVQQELAAIA